MSKNKNMITLIQINLAMCSRVAEMIKTSGKSTSKWLESVDDPEWFDMLQTYAAMQVEAKKIGMDLLPLIEGLTVESVAMKPAEVIKAKEAALAAGDCDCPICITHRNVRKTVIRGHEADVVILDEYRGRMH